MLHIKDFNYTDDHYAALVAINDPIWPERPLTVADFEHEDKGRGVDAEKYAQRWLAEMGGQIVGHAHAMHEWQRTDVNRYMILVEVLPEARQQGVGSALLAAIERGLAKNTPYELVTDTMEDRVEAIGWLERRAFKQMQREPMSALDVQTFDARRFSGAVEKTTAHNITIQTLSELAQTDPHYKHKLFDLVWAIITDVPGSNADKRERPSYEYLEQQLMGDPTFTPDAWFVAVERPSNQFVGSCNVHPKSLDGHWNNGLTGVLRSHRRKGIATTLKLASIAHVKATGGVEISTSNEENNPMYDLNRALGFEPRPAILIFERT